MTEFVLFIFFFRGGGEQNAPQSKQIEHIFVTELLRRAVSQNIG